MGNLREDLTGYRTQQEYDDARQQRIDLNTIKTLENTLQTKYLDKGRSLDETELDERLAALRSQMGITPNTAEQNEQQFLDFGNELAENTKQTIFPAPTIEPNAQGYLYPTEGIAGIQFPQSELNTTAFFPLVENLRTKSPQQQLYPEAMVQANDDIYKNARVELTTPQLNFLNSAKTQRDLKEGFLEPQQVFDKLPYYEEKTPFNPFIGDQKPTTEEEYNNYLRSIGITKTI